MSISFRAHSGIPWKSPKDFAAGSLDCARDDRTKGRKGIFTAELERALIEKRIDVAVHSAKDLPSEMDKRAYDLPGFSWPRVASVEDLLLRKAQLLWGRLVNALRQEVCGDKGKCCWRTPPDAAIVALRGNVPTRLRNIHRKGDWGRVLFWRAPAWSGSDSCHRSLNLKARSFLPKYSRQKIFCRLAVRAYRFANTRSRLGRARNHVVD